MKLRDYIRACVWFVRRLRASRRWGIDPTLSSFEWWVEKAQKARDDVFRAAIVAHHSGAMTDLFLRETMNDYITERRGPLKECPTCGGTGNDPDPIVGGSCRACVGFGKIPRIEKRKP